MAVKQKGQGMAGSSFVTQTVVSVTESAANTLTFLQIQSAIAPTDKIGWVIEGIEFRFSGATLGYFNSTTDTLQMALTVSNQLTALSDTDPAVIYKRALCRTDFGTAASASFYDLMLKADFSQYSGGGLLVLPTPIYLGVLGAGLSTAASVIARIFFTPIEMNDQDWMNLVMSRQILINS
jgi:hypothetical protein